MKHYKAIVSLMMFVHFGCSVPVSSIRSSVSVRNPRADTRVVGIDTVSNGMDYEIAIGATRKKGGSSAEVWAWSDRSSGIRTTSYEHHISQDIFSYRTGWDFVNRNDNPHMYLNAFYAEKRYGPIGIGFTRSYSQEWFGFGEFMGRASIDFSQTIIPSDSLPIDVVFKASYAFNGSASSASANMSIIGLCKAGVSVVPSFSIAQSRPANKDPITSYQGKITVEVKVEN